MKFFRKKSQKSGFFLRSTLYIIFFLSLYTSGKYQLAKFSSGKKWNFWKIDLTDSNPRPSFGSERFRPLGYEFKISARWNLGNRNECTAHLNRAHSFFVFEIIQNWRGEFRWFWCHFKAGNRSNPTTPRSWHISLWLLRYLIKCEKCRFLDFLSFFVCGACYCPRRGHYIDFTVYSFKKQVLGQKFEIFDF